MFERVLIANRGEIAVRIARTLRALGCSPAAVHARGDPALAAVRACDVSVEITSYLDVEEIVAAALRVGAQALHPGYGFLSERPELARACVAAGVTWIGPPAEVIELMGDKTAARRLAAATGVPVLPGIDDPTAALTSSGSPCSRANSATVAAVGSSMPGSTGTPVDAASRRAAVLSPISSIASAGGPIQVTPAATHARASSGRSERKP